MDPTARISPISIKAARTRPMLKAKLDYLAESRRATLMAAIITARVLAGF
jgi:hypothetical protein